MQQPTLLVMAAGMGSRYGGLKQVDPVGPGGETIIDYSVYDAIRAGFGKLVFVIRHEIEADFRALVGRKFEGKLPVEYAFQQLAMVPDGFTVPPGRKKPWGTGHAILSAGELIREPFAVINADDFYGADSFRVLCGHLKNVGDLSATQFAMVGFILRNTLSEHGTVARGVSRSDGQGYLEQVVELLKIAKHGQQARNTDEVGGVQTLTGDELVSMNMWGFTPAIFGHLREQFVRFLEQRSGEEKSELLIPTVVNMLVTQRIARVKVLPTRDSWFGVTYKEDRPIVIEKVRQLIANGAYPANLWD